MTIINICNKCVRLASASNMEHQTSADLWDELINELADNHELEPMTVIDNVLFDDSHIQENVVKVLKDVLSSDVCMLDNAKIKVINDNLDQFDDDELKRVPNGYLKEGKKRHDEAFESILVLKSVYDGLHELGKDISFKDLLKASKILSTQHRVCQSKIAKGSKKGHQCQKYRRYGKRYCAYHCKDKVAKK